MEEQLVKLKVNRAFEILFAFILKIRDQNQSERRVKVVCKSKLVIHKLAEAAKERLKREHSLGWLRA